MAAGRVAEGRSSQAGAALSISSFEKACHELPNMMDMPVMVSADEYPQIVEFVRQISPMLRNDNERINKAHARALRTTNEDVLQALQDQKKIAEFHEFKRNVNQFIRYNRPNITTDLSTMINKVMELSEGSRCGGAFLAHFYARFIKELDPFGSITFGLTEDRAPEDTLLLQVALPDEIRSAPPVKTQGYTEIVTLPKLQRSPVVDGALRALEQGYTSQLYRVILFDLRSSSGIDVAVVSQIRASAARGWGAMPIVIWVNRETRGVAALVTQQFSGPGHSNVLVVSADEETYGYGRKLEQRSTTLPGLAPFTLSLGAELLQPPSLDVDPNGYRVRVDSDRILAKDKADKAIERAEQWSTQAPKGDLSMLVQKDQSAPQNVTASGEAVPDPRNPGDAPAAASNGDSGQSNTNPFAFGDGQAQQPGNGGGSYDPDPTAPPTWAQGSGGSPQAVQRPTDANQ